MGPWTPFQQSEALTTRLANILDEYPPGTSTLREFVQNADDACASRIVLCLDCSSHGGKGALPTDPLAEYTGPSLLVYNDSTFSENDFLSITSIGRSQKREDATTIGKYGLGFNVVYHFTDLPQFVSGDTVVLFDPHGRALPGDGDLGMRAKFVDGLAAQYPGLLDPLLQPLDRLHGKTQGSRPARHDAAVDATLFRLPLRTSTQAQSSDLSQREVSPSEVRGLLETLCTDGLGEMLLFTQHLTSIECCVLEADGRLVSLGAAAVKGAEEVAVHRAALAALATGGQLMPTISHPLVYNLELIITPGDSSASKEEEAAPVGLGTTQERWLMCGGVLQTETALDLAASLGQPAAWASVAVPLHGPICGRAFCFLPLPLPSGLPVHVNGCFAVTSNRRELWVEDEARQSLSHQHARKARWNALLCHAALPSLYAHAVAGLARDDGSCPTVDRLGSLLGQLWPVHGENHGVLWRSLQRQVIRLIDEQGIPCCACFSPSGDLILAALREVVLANADMASGHARHKLRVALAQCQVYLWSAPRGAADALEAATGAKPHYATPASICATLASAAKDDDLPGWWDRGMVAELLEMVFACARTSITQSTAGAQSIAGGGEDEEDEEEDPTLTELVAAGPLEGLRVVPLADGSLGVLHRLGRQSTRSAQAPGKAAGGNGNRGSGKASSTFPTYFMADVEAHELLARCNILVEAEALELPGFRRLKSLANSGSFNLEPQLDAKALLRPECMGKLLPSGWRGRALVFLTRGPLDESPGALALATAPEMPVGTAAAAVETGTDGSRGWQPKGKFGKKDKKKNATPDGDFWKKKSSDAAPSILAPPLSTSVQAEMYMEEKVLARRLRFLWTRVDLAVFGAVGGGWGGLEVERLEDWPTVPTATGAVLSIRHAKRLHTFRSTVFLESDRRSALLTFGLSFSVLDSLFLNRRVCSGPEALGRALEVACSQKKEEAAVISASDASVPNATAPNTLPLANAEALRDLLIQYCVLTTSTPSDKDYPGADSRDDGDNSHDEEHEANEHAVEVGSDSGGMAPLVGSQPPGELDLTRDEEDYDYEGARRTHGLPLQVVRRLPIFMTLNQDRCVPLVQGILGAPGSYQPGSSLSCAYQEESSLDLALADSMGSELLSYRTLKERMMLRLAAWPRGTVADLVHCLAVKLRRQHTVLPPPRDPSYFLRHPPGSSLPATSSNLRAAQPTLSTTLELPIEALKILLAAVGGSKEGGLSASERDELARRLAGVPVVVLVDGERRFASECVDPTDDLLAQAMRAAEGESTFEATPAQPPSTDLSALGFFPPPTYLDSPQIIAGLRACGMRSLDEPATYLLAVDGIAKAAHALVDLEQGSEAGSLGSQRTGAHYGTRHGARWHSLSPEERRIAACATALLRLLLLRWSKLGSAMQAYQIQQLRRIPFIPCVDNRALMLPDEAVPPPNPRSRVVSAAAATAAVRGKAGKRGKERRGRAGGGGGGGSNRSNGAGTDARSLLQEGLNDAADDEALLDELGFPSIETGAGAGAGTGAGYGASDLVSPKLNDELGQLRMDSASKLVAWWHSCTPAQALPPSSDRWLQWMSFSDAVCLRSDAYLAWSQCCILPECMDKPTLAVLEVLGVRHPVPPSTACKHIACVTRRWESAPMAWRDATGPNMRQALSLFCCAHTAMLLRDQASVSGFSGAGELTTQLGEHQLCKRALVDAPFIACDDGSLLPPRCVCTDLFSDLSPTLRAVPSAYAAALTTFLVEVGGCLTSTALEAPEIKVTAPNPQESLLSLIQTQYDDPTFADVLFDFGDGPQGGVCYAHRLVLALVSPTFAAMFAPTFAEGAHLAAGRTQIPMDPLLFSCDTFRLVLIYIYTGELLTAGRGEDELATRPKAQRGAGSNGSSAHGLEPLRPTDDGVRRLLEVLQATDYLELDHLKQVGERLFIDWECLQVENCVVVYQHACAVHCGGLRATCVQFIRGMFDVVKETEAYRGLPEELQREVQEIPRGKESKKGGRG